MSDRPPAARPIIVLAAPTGTDFQPRGGGKPKTRVPDRARQGERLTGKLEELERLLDGTSTATVTVGLPDSDPELVVVFEAIDSTSATLNDALSKVGLEPLLEVEGDIADADLAEDWARLTPPTTDAEPIKLYLHASMANQQAVQQLITLWNLWKQNKRMPNGYSGFTDLFKHLRDVRRWGPADRVRTTGLAAMLSERLADQLTDVPIHVELWFRANAERRARAEEDVRRLIESGGGQVLGRAEIPEIGYHALAAQYPAALLAPAANLADVAALETVALLQSTDLLYVRPGGQTVDVVLDDDLETSAPVDMADSLGPPLVAVLDGLPASNHPRLNGRVDIVDPEDFAGQPAYTVERRRHGTMVASAVIWGDLNGPAVPTGRRVAVRPVLKPDLATRQHDEAIPWGDLPPAIMMQAVRDVLGEDGDGPIPTVKVFNVSLGDPLAVFDTVPSAWARAIDWLAYTYNVLFVVSAGNHPGTIPIDATVLRQATGRERDRLLAEALAPLSSARRLLPPGESLNALTVGATHADAATGDFEVGYNVDPWGTPNHPSPVSAHGRGIRRALKPDLAAPGGRKLYSPRMMPPPGIEPARSGHTKPPGVLVAAPPNNQVYDAGTTFAAAEVTRRAAQIIDSLNASDNAVPDRHLAVAAKALVVHGVAYPRNVTYGVSTDRLVGNGLLLRNLADGCTSRQATVLFTGEIGARQQTKATVPLPRELALLRDVRGITMTLAWFSPINWKHRQYRRAKLTVDGPNELGNSIDREQLGVDYDLTHRGTVQHRAFTVRQAVSAEDLTFTVKCADQAGGFAGTIPFALAVTLEVGATVNLDVYELVRLRFATRIHIETAHRTIG